LVSHSTKGCVWLSGNSSPRSATDCVLDGSRCATQVIQQGPPHGSLDTELGRGPGLLRLSIVVIPPTAYMLTVGPLTLVDSPGEVCQRHALLPVRGPRSAWCLGPTALAQIRQRTFAPELARGGVPEQDDAAWSGAGRCAERSSITEQG
jgi:hypothetical protein